MPDATIYDVAEIAGVSISTVSRVLNAPEQVHVATRTRVLAAIDQLNFVPRAEATARARKAMRRIGVLAPFFTYPSFVQRLRGVANTLAGFAYEMVIYNVESDVRRDGHLASLPVTRRIDGLIIMALPLDEAIAERLKRQRLPVVLVDAPRPDFDCVSTDNHGGGWLVATHLLAKGHRRFGFVGEWQQSHAYVSPSERRLSGLRDALATKGVSLPDDAVRLVNHGVEEACAAAHVLLDAAQPPTAIFAYDDLLAGGVLRAARRRGLAVPDDLAVVGFDDSDIAQALDLTTVRARFEESGRLGVRALLDLLQDRSTGGGHTTLRVELVERGTT